MMRFLILLVCFYTAAFAKPPTATELLNDAENLYRSESSYAEISMDIVNPNWSRSLKLKAWSMGDDFTLIRILSPKKDKGVSTLRRNKDMWNYFPKINREMKVPPSMMMGSWMGSDFSNDDLVKQTDLTDEYDIELQVLKDTYQLLLKPKSTTATVWGRIEVVLNKSSKLPLEYRYFDEKGKAMRTMTFGSPKKFGKILLPSKLEMINLSKPGHKTSITYNRLDLNIGLKKSFFSLHNLKKKI